MARHGLARAAFEAGKTRYFTGEVCKNGHIDERMISNGACVSCLRNQRNRYRVKHPETHLKAIAKYKETHLELLRKRSRETQRRLRQAYPEREKATQLRWRQRREDKLAAEAGRPRSSYCEICMAQERTVFDHSHQKGHFRGWICDRCNKILGLVRDDISHLKALQIYLEQLEYSVKEVA